MENEKKVFDYYYDDENNQEKTLEKLVELRKLISAIYSIRSKKNKNEVIEENLEFQKKIASLEKLSKYKNLTSLYNELRESVIEDNEESVEHIISKLNLEDDEDAISFGYEKLFNLTDQYISEQKNLKMNFTSFIKKNIYKELYKKYYMEQKKQELYDLYFIDKDIELVKHIKDQIDEDILRKLFETKEKIEYYIIPLEDDLNNDVVEKLLEMIDSLLRLLKKIIDFGYEEKNIYTITKKELDEILRLSETIIKELEKKSHTLKKDDECDYKIIKTLK